jgi:hypothetical protein
VVLSVVAVAVFAGLGRMVLQKIKADRAAKATKVAGPLDEKTRAWISDVVRTPRK